MTREPGRAAEPSVEDLVPAGTPIDLDNCAREPIHIPGSIQPRGVLAVVDEHDFTVRHVSANVAELLDRPFHYPTLANLLPEGADFVPPSE